MSTLDTILPVPRFWERHQRVVSASPEAAWRAVLGCTGREIRALGPLMATRTLPAVLRGRAGLRWGASDQQTILSVFEGAGWVRVRRDQRPVDGRATLVSVGVGRFWSPTRNQPVPVETAKAFEEFSTPGYVKAGFEFTVAPHPRGALVTTETRVIPTDQDAERAFRRYWLLIRLPSGLIRRSWLAAIARRATGA